MKVEKAGGRRDDEPDRLCLREAPLRPGSGVQGLAPEPGDGEPSPADRQSAVGATPQTGAAGGEVVPEIRAVSYAWSES